MDYRTSAWVFNTLDMDQDGRLSRDELNLAAKRLGWSWREAPLLAILDLLTIPKPMAQSEFNALIQRINSDPLGPYGDILLQSPHCLEQARLKKSGAFNEKKYRQNNPNLIKKQKRFDTSVIDQAGLDQAGLDQPGIESLTTLLSRNEGDKTARQYQTLLENLESVNLLTENTAVLIIDPQKSFTKGAWMHSIGTGGKKDVAPIQLAFDRCAVFLKRFYGQLEIMFTRCPFPADSYGWAGPLANLLSHDQCYFIKPGNSVLFPPTNGFRPWVRGCLKRIKKTLVIGGCTLNSCVRVSSIETVREFRKQDLHVIVDLSLSGARTRNYQSSQEYNGESAVKSAIKQMINEGVQVVRQINWL